MARARHRKFGSLKRRTVCACITELVAYLWMVKMRRARCNCFAVTFAGVCLFLYYATDRKSPIAGWLLRHSTLHSEFQIDDGGETISHTTNLRPANSNDVSIYIGVLSESGDASARELDRTAFLSALRTNTLPGVSAEFVVACGPADKEENALHGDIACLRSTEKLEAVRFLVQRGVQSGADFIVKLSQGESPNLPLLRTVLNVTILAHRAVFVTSNPGLRLDLGDYGRGVTKRDEPFKWSISPTSSVTQLLGSSFVLARSLGEDVRAALADSADGSKVHAPPKFRSVL